MTRALPAVIVNLIDPTGTLSLSSVFGSVEDAFSDIGDALGSAAEGLAKGLEALGNLQTALNVAIDLSEGHFRDAIAEGAGYVAEELASAGCNVAADAVTGGAADLSGVGELACAVGAGQLGQEVVQKLS